MPRDEPAWWYGAAGDRRARLLAPASHVYGWAAERRYRRAVPYRSHLPMICIGNFTAGGTGKTPLALLVAAIARAQGALPVFLSRGYGGANRGPLRVEAGRTNAAEAGDEPLILARTAPTVVARDRAAGARYIEATMPDAGVVVMDDGLQNGALAKDLTIAVVDGRRGIGNGEVIPAGPLRAPLPFQLELTDAIVVNGPAGREDDTASVLGRLRRQFEGPVLSAGVVVRGDAEWLRGAVVVAYAGIGVPARFFATLRAAGADVAAEFPFPDHHAFTEADAAQLLAAAAAKAAVLVTTEKDHARLSGALGLRAELAAASRILPIGLHLEARDRDRLDALVGAALKRSG